MDGSPYTPGASRQPPVLAGRDGLLEAWSIGLNDVAATGRRRAPDVILTAPRGAGKTATVGVFRQRSTEQGYEVVRLQAAAGEARLVDSLIRRAAARVDAGSGPWARARRAFDRLAGVNITAAGVGAGVSFHNDQGKLTGAASPEDLAEALVALDDEVRKDHPQGGVLITVDEIQSAAASDLALLAAALSSLNDDHVDAHVMFAATGLPNSFQAFAEAHVTHADRLFKFRPISVVLEPEHALYAIVEPARRQHVAWDPAAAALIVKASRGYPPHVQYLADHTWIGAPGPTVITETDAHEGVAAASEDLARESLGPRFDTLTDREREFLTALAVNGGHTTTATLATTLGRTRASISDLHANLIAAGDAYAPRRGEIALTAPLFGNYLLASYEEGRELATARLLPLSDMQRNADAIRQRAEPASDVG